MEKHPRRLPSSAEVTENLARIRELDDGIRDLDKRITELKEIRSQMRRERANRASFIATFRRLPSEILGEIATHAVSFGQGANRLNQVCSSMRVAVNGMKQLWCEIIIYRTTGRVIHLGDPSIRCRNPKYLKIVLERAAPMPLTIHIDIDVEDDPFPTDMFTALSPFAKYIRSFIVEDIHAARGSLPSLALTNLETMQIKNFEDPYPESWIDSLYDMANCSQHPYLQLRLNMCMEFETYTSHDHPLFNRLKHLELHSGLDLESTDGIPSFMPQLEELTLHGGQYIIMNRLQLPNLQVMSWKNMRRLPPPTEIPSSISDRLQTLHLDNVCVNVTASIGQPIVFNSLSCLTLSNLKFYSPLHTTFTFPNLEELILSNLSDELYNEASDSPLPSAMRVLGPLPQVKRLWMDDLNEDWAINTGSFPGLVAFRVTFCDHLFEPSNFFDIFTDEEFSPNLTEIWFHGFDSFWATYTVTEAREAAEEHRPNLRVYGDETAEGSLQYPFRCKLVDPFRARQHGAAKWRSIQR